MKNGTLGDAFIERLVRVASELRIGRRDDEPQSFMGGDLFSSGGENA